MLIQPHISEQVIKECLETQYDVSVNRIDFLPIGNDVDTAVYKVTQENGAVLFLKLRSGELDEASVMIPKILSDSGNQHVIAPLFTKDSQLWSHLDEYTVTLFLYIDGKNGFEIEMAHDHWINLGSMLKEMHHMRVPEKIQKTVPRERYSSKWRDEIKLILERVEKESFTDPIARRFAEFIKEKRIPIEQLIHTAEKKGFLLKGKEFEYVLCHADIHAGNILIDTQKNMYVVDWDTLIFAPKERDLMFIGAGIGGVWDRDDENELFYQGYGHDTVDSDAITYYRCERIIEDIVAYGDQILQNHGSVQDRESGVVSLIEQFQPNSVVDRALR